MSFNSNYKKCTNCDGDGIVLICEDCEKDTENCRCPHPTYEPNDCKCCEGTGRELRHLDTQEDY